MTASIIDEQGNEWFSIIDQPPPNDVEIHTAIYDRKGGWRNKQSLIRSRRLWFLPDMAMYVYYTPTHWRPLKTKQKKADPDVSLPKLPPIPEEETNHGD